MTTVKQFPDLLVEGNERDGNKIPMVPEDLDSLVDAQLFEDTNNGTVVAKFSINAEKIDEYVAKLFPNASKEEIYQARNDAYMALIRPLQHYIRGVLESKLDYDELVSGEVQLVHNELLGNIIENNLTEHETRDALTIDITIVADKNEVVYDIRHDGDPYFWTDDGLEEPPKGFEDRGRGRFLILQLSDKITSHKDGLGFRFHHYNKEAYVKKEKVKQLT